MKPERPSRVGDNVATGDRETAVKSITARETASISRLSDRSLRYVRTYVHILLRSRFRLTSTRNLQFKSRVHRDDKVSCEATSVNSVNYRYKFQRFSRRGEENSRGTIFSKIIDSEIFRDRRIGWKIRYTV